MKEKLVEKLFHGTCSEDELTTLFKIIERNSTPPDSQLMERLWLEVEKYPDLKLGLHDRILEKVLSKIDVKTKDNTETIPGSRQRTLFELSHPKLFAVLSIAASVLLIIWIGTGVSGSNNKNRVVQTAFGERQSLELSDGSLVELNANSQVTYDAEWSDHLDREVWLKGEAFFEVKKKPETEQKLRVVTDDLIVEVLGTSFNVNSNGGKTSVYLEEGQIRLYLNDLDSTILMKPGDLIVYSEQNHKIIRKSQESTDLYTSWKNGVLIFKASSLREVLQKIENIYGTKFKLKNQADYSREIDFPLPIDELETTISILDKTISDLEIRKEGDAYIVE